MPEHDPDLKRAFALVDDPVDDGFTVAVSTRVARKERVRSAGRWAQFGAIMVAGAAVAYGVVGAAQSLGPTLMGEVGLGLAQAHGALAGGSLSAGLGAAVIPLFIAVAAGVGGLAVARATVD
ncbi:MAG: hypothetical protein GC206_02715 [Alphaproteobacteria bacterium]|nr:hypothetical protein [Alphaproteobacteria bacterium]